MTPVPSKRVAEGLPKWMCRQSGGVVQFYPGGRARGGTSDHIADFKNSCAVDTQVAVGPTIPSESFGLRNLQAIDELALSRGRQPHGCQQKQTHGECKHLYKRTESMQLSTAALSQIGYERRAGKKKYR